MAKRALGEGKIMDFGMTVPGRIKNNGFWNFCWWFWVVSCSTSLILEPCQCWILLRQMIHCSKSSVLVSQLPWQGGKTWRRCGEEVVAQLHRRSWARDLIICLQNWSRASCWGRAWAISRTWLEWKTLLREVSAAIDFKSQALTFGRSARARTARARQGGDVPDCSGKGQAAPLGMQREMRAVFMGCSEEEVEGWWQGRGAAGAEEQEAAWEEIALALWYFHVLLQEFALAMPQKSQQQLNKKKCK